MSLESIRGVMTAYPGSHDIHGVVDSGGREATTHVLDCGQARSYVQFCTFLRQVGAA